MDISVIIPCYNLKDYIGRCLKSVLSQKLSGAVFEIIFVPDSCTDDSAGIAEKILTDGGVPFAIITANVKKAGLARNIGLAAARGDYIYFMDGDDYFVDEHALQKMIDNIKMRRSNVVYMTKFESEDQKVKDDYAIWRFFIKRSLIGNTKFPPLTTEEDWEFIRKLRLKDEYDESRVDDILYHYTHPREGSITASVHAMHVWEKTHKDSDGGITRPPY